MTLTPEALAAAVDAEEIDTVVVGFTDHYGRLVGKRYDARFFLDQVADDGTHGCDYLLTTDMEMEPVPGYSFASWERGYGDFHLVPGPRHPPARRAGSTARRSCSATSSACRPTRRWRSLPARSCAARSTAAASAGLRAMAATELEYYLFRTSYRGRGGLGLRRPRAGRLVPRGLPPPPGRPHRGLPRRGPPAPQAAPASRSRTPRASGAVGQHELNIRYAEILEMADRHVVYKQCAQGARRPHGRERHLHGQAVTPSRPARAATST